MGDNNDSTRGRPTGEDASAETRALLRKVLDRDRSACRELAQRIRPVAERRIRGLLLRTLRVRQELDVASLLEDAMQEFLWTLFRDDAAVLRAWSPERASLESYLGAVALNVARNVAAKQDRRLRQEGLAYDGAIEAAGSLPSAEAQIDARSTAQRLLRDLDPEERRMVLAYFLERRAAKDVAAAFGRTESAIHQWAMRMRQRMSAEYLGLAEERR